MCCVGAFLLEISAAGTSSRAASLTAEQIVAAQQSQPLSDAAAALTDNCCYGVTVPRKYDAALWDFFSLSQRHISFPWHGQHQLQKQKGSACRTSFEGPYNVSTRAPSTPHPPEKPCVAVLHRSFLKREELAWKIGQFRSDFLIRDIHARNAWTLFLDCSHTHPFLLLQVVCSSTEGRGEQRKLFQLQVARKSVFLSTPGFSFTPFTPNTCSQTVFPTEVKAARCSFWFTGVYPSVGIGKADEVCAGKVMTDCHTWVREIRGIHLAEMGKNQSICIFP